MKRLSLILLALVLALSSALPAAAEEEIKTYTLMISANADTPAWEDYWFAGYLEEQLGVRFEATQVSQEGFAEKVNLAFATQQLPDLLLGGLTNEEIATYGAQGLILPLEDYLTWENTPTIMAWFEIVDGYKSALYYPDGHIYDLQGFNTMNRELNTQRYWINAEWCEEAIGKLPETLDEYYDYLTYVKENDMNGNGDPNDEVPLAGKTTSYSSQNYFDGVLPILFAFGLTTRTLEAVDGVVQYNPVQPVFKEFLKYMNTLYEEGLLDEGYFTQTDDQYVAKISNHQAGVFNDWAQWLRISDINIWQEYSSNKPMTSEFNDERKWGYNDMTLDRHFIITKACDDPLGLLKVLDWMMTDTYDTPDGKMTEERAALVGEYEEYVMRQYSGRLSQTRGAEQGTWDKYPEYGWIWTEGENANGHFWSTDITYPKDEFVSADAFQAKMTPNAFPIPNLVIEQFTDVGQQALSDQTAIHNAPYAHVGWSPNIKLTADEATEATLIKVNLDAYLDAMYAKFVIGEADIDAEFDAYVAELEARELDRYLEIYQTAYDRWANAGK